jgi:putative transposase
LSLGGDQWEKEPRQSSSGSRFAVNHDNIFVERLWWTVKHEWVYLRPAADGLEQKRSLVEFFDWYNRLRPHQAIGWQTPDEAYFGPLAPAAAA